MTVEVVAGLVEAYLVRASPTVRLIELNEIVFPKADAADRVCSGAMVNDGEKLAARARVSGLR